MVENPAELSLSRNQVLLVGQEGSNQVPAEDLTALVLDNPQITVTTALLAHLGREGCAVLVCDQKHMPCGLYLPFHQHSRVAQVAARQAASSLPFRKRVWQGLVRQKIINQALTLDFCGLEGGRQLRKLLAGLDSGDSRNIEAQAARLYWVFLLGPRFIRRDYRDEEVDRVNGALNYGYAVLRSVVAQALAGRGLLPVFGVKHDNNLNAFNLADDFIEPCRPVAERAVWTLKKTWEASTEGLTREDRRTLALLAHKKMRLAGQVVPVSRAAEMMASSLVKALERHEYGLLELPEVLATEMEDGDEG
jgi:CRISPR-associated protein Cas1